MYFNVAAFKKDHDYAKLAPWSAGHMGLLAEGEGSLGANLRGKRSPFDFALWKASKPGEPEWDSPWGKVCVHDGVVGVVGVVVVVVVVVTIMILSFFFPGTPWMAH